MLRSYRSWDFPKGRVEDGETLLEAAMREAQEEADLVQVLFPWGHGYCTTQPYGRGKVASYFIGQTEDDRIVLPVNPAIGRPEHHEGRWVSFSEAAFMLPPRLQPILTWTYNVVVEGRTVTPYASVQPTSKVIIPFPEFAERRGSVNLAVLHEGDQSVAGVESDKDSDEDDLDETSEAVKRRMS